MSALANRLQSAHDALRDVDPHLYDLVDFMSEVGATLEEIEGLALDRCLVIEDGALLLTTYNDERWVDLSIHAVELLTYLALPAGDDVRDVRRRWFVAMHERGIDVHLDAAVRILAEARRELDERPGLQ